MNALPVPESHPPTRNSMTTRESNFCCIHVVERKRGIDDGCDELGSRAVREALEVPKARVREAMDDRDLMRAGYS